MRWNKTVRNDNWPKTEEIEDADRVDAVQSNNEFFSFYLHFLIRKQNL